MFEESEFVRREAAYTRRVDRNALEVLEFPAIAERLANATASSHGAELARSLRGQVEERMATARHFRVFPGEGVHSDALAELVLRLDKLGFRGDYSFEVFNDDYRQLPLPTVAERARRSVKWVTDQVSRRSLPPRRTGA